MDGKTITIGNKQFVIKKVLKSVDNESIAFLEADDVWRYGIKQNGKWNKLNVRMFPKLKMFRKVKDDFINKPSISTLEKVYDELMDSDKYTKILNVAELKYSNCDKFKSLTLKTNNWMKFVTKDQLSKVMLK